MESDLQDIFYKHHKTLFFTRKTPRDVKLSVCFLDNAYQTIQMRLIEPLIDKIIESAKNMQAELVYDIVHCDINRVRILSIGFSGHTVHTEYLMRNHFPSMGLRSVYKY